MTFVSAALFVACAGLFSMGCEDAKVTEKTEVKDKLLGGEKVEKTRVIETDDKVRVEKEKTDIGHNGDVKSQEKTITEDKKVK